MRRPLSYILASAVLVLAVIIIFCGEYVYTIVVEPVAHILWLFYRTLCSIDQKIYWVLLIFALLPLIIRLLPETTEYSIKAVNKNPYPEDDRVRYWETLIRTAVGDKHERMRLQRSLQTLSQSIEDLSFGNTSPVMLLPTIKKSFQGWIRDTKYLSPFLRYILQNKRYRVSKLDMDIDHILKSMEQKMEGNHD